MRGSVSLQNGRDTQKGNCMHEIILRRRVPAWIFNITLGKPWLPLSLLTLAAFLCATDPGTAAAMSGNGCRDKYTACNIRCFQRYSSSQDAAISCISRTCNRQYDNCVKASGSTGTRTQVDPPKGPPIKPTTIPGTRPGGGILDTPSYGIPMHRPSSTGTRAPN
jgi:hypothetical protein